MMRTLALALALIGCAAPMAEPEAFHGSLRFSLADRAIIDRGAFSAGYSVSWDLSGPVTPATGRVVIPWRHGPSKQCGPDILLADPGDAAALFLAYQ